MNGRIIYPEDEIYLANDRLSMTLESGRYSDLKNHFTSDIVMGNVMTRPLHGIDAASDFLTALLNINVPNAETLWQTTHKNRLIIKWRQYYCYNAKDLGKDHLYCDGFGEMIYSGDGKFSWYYGTFNPVAMIAFLFKNLTFKQNISLFKQMRLARTKSNNCKIGQ
jgi:hypothetical protein